MKLSRRIILGSLLASPAAALSLPSRPVITVSPPASVFKSVGGTGKTIRIRLPNGFVVTDTHRLV